MLKRVGFSKLEMSGAEKKVNERLSNSHKVNSLSFNELIVKTCEVI